MAIQIKLKNSVVQDSTPSTSDLPAVGEIALNANINSIGGFMRASDNSIVKIFGPGSLSTPTATTTVSGISELATNSETTTGTATNRVVTPAGLNAVTVAERSTSNSTYLALAGGTLTGVLAATAGSNSAPSIHFGDSDSGIFGGTNTVSLAAGGTTRLTADTGVSVVGTLAVTGAITSTSDLTIPDKIIHSGDTNTAIRFPAADTVSVETGGNEAFRINSTGQLLHGHNASIGVGRDIETSSTSGFGGIAINRFSADTGSGGLDFVKSRNTSLGGNTIVQSGDNLGAITWRGADGTDFATPAAQIIGAVDGTPGSNDMPGRLVFSTTADGAASLTERLRIDSAGTSTFSGDLTISNTQPRLTFSDSNNNPDYFIDGNAGALRFYDVTNGATRFQINSDGHVDVNGHLDVGAGIDITGNSTFGGSGTNAVEINGTGGHELYSYHDSGGVGWATGAGSSYGELLYLDESGSAVKLYAGGSLRLSANSSGATVTGNIVVSGTVDAVDGDFDGTLEADAITVGGVALNTVIAGVTVTNATNAANITAADESSDTTCFPVFVTAATGNLAPKTGSNLSFNSSSGRLTATSFAGDGSNLTGVGGEVVDDTSPQLGGNLDCNNKVISLNDSTASGNNRIKFGNAGDLQIYHDSSHSYIVDSGTGELRLRGADAIRLQDSDSGEDMALFNKNGSVDLFHNDSKKFETTANGASITGKLDLSSHLDMPDSAKVNLGNSDDLELYHDGNNNYIDGHNGVLYIRGSNNVIALQATDGEHSVRCAPNGEVKLYNNNNLRFETTGNGVDIQSGQDISMDSSGNGQLRLLGNGYSGGIALNTTGMHIYHNAASRVIIFGINESEVARFNTDGHFIPSANNTRDLGTSSTRWRNLYTNDLNLSNEGGANDVDGTWGSYTIQEGAESLFLINKRSGKKYKFNLTEVA